MVPEEIADSWWLLALYVFMFLNLEVVVAYWLAQPAFRRGHAVHAGGHGVAAARRCSARRVYFRDVDMIFITIVCAETLKNCASTAGCAARGLLVFRWDRDVLREQVRAGAPLGLGSMLNKANEFGRVVVGTQHGTGAAGHLHHRGTTRCRW
jgi:hypothetical protein